MKKKYITPCTNVINVQASQHLLAASAPTQPHIEVDENTTIDADASYSRENNNLWDNVWE